MHRMINTHIEASKIGRQIAVQVLDHHRRAGDSSSGMKNLTKNQKNEHESNVSVYRLQSSTRDSGTEFNECGIIIR